MDIPETYPGKELLDNTVEIEEIRTILNTSLDTRSWTKVRPARGRSGTRFALLFSHASSCNICFLFMGEENVEVWDLPRHCPACEQMERENYSM